MTNSTGSTVEGFRLSPQQRNLWSLQQTAGAQTFRASCVILIEGALQSDVLQAAVRDVVDRHEILRTTFTRPPGIKTPFQVVAEAPQFSWQTFDLSGVGANQQNAQVEECFANERERPFDFASGPLLRITLIKQSNGRHWLLISLPALCADSITLANLTSEIQRGYASRLSKQEPSDEPMQYADFAEWQNELLEAMDEHGVAGKNYWQQQDAGDIPALALPFEKRVNATQASAFESVVIDLDCAFRSLETAAREHEVSVPALLFACWHALVWRLAGQSESEFVIFSLCDGRKFEDLESALGLYAKYLPLRFACEENSFSEHLRRVSDNLNRADEWQEYFDPCAHGNLIKDSVAFDFLGARTALSAGFSIIKQDVCLAPFKLKLSCVRSGDSISVELQYDGEVFERETVARFAGYFQRFLSHALQNPKSEIGAIDILSDEERHRLLVELNQTAAEFSEAKCIHQKFEEQAERAPAAPAVISGDVALTYEELNARANQLAHLLRRRGVGPDACVGLCVERSVEMIVGLLGILKAGGAYVPLNPDHPRERLAIQLAESKASLLITNGATDQSFPFAGETIDLARDRALLEAEPKTNPSSITTPENLVYVIYTSGSTGIPKGVAVRHRNLANYTQFILQRLGVNGPLHFATVSTLTADLGNTCIFPALVSGGCLHVIGYDVAMEGNLFSEYLARHPIDVLKIVPSHFSALLASQPDGNILPKKYLILGGEALSWDLVQQVSRMDHTCQIINHYGPTETTVGSLTFNVPDNRVSPYSLTVPIGRPIANTRAYILDRRRQPVPPGVAGELYLGGAGVAAGYLNNSTETDARFVPDPFSEDSDARLYRTGDLARYLLDDNIEFLGRVDTQVKVRGYRVELGEIEAALSAHSSVRQAVVGSAPGSADILSASSAVTRLIAYIVPSDAHPPTSDALRNLLQQQLPDYMVPSVFVFLKSLPLTANGKIDRNALPPPDELRPGLQKEFVAPRTKVEKELADIWTGLLKVSAVGVHDNFFDLGGHSLLATQVVSRMRKEFQMEIPLRSLFESPTVAQLAEKIESANGNDTDRLLAELADLDALSDAEAERLLELEQPSP